MNIERLALKYGLMTFALLGIYFLIMKMLGLIHVFELRILNGFIMFGGIYFGIKRLLAHNELDYAKGLGLGVFIGIISAGLFSLFGIVYLKVIDPAFMDSIRENEILGMYMSPVMSVFQIFIEGVASALIFSLAIMQLYKKPDAKNENE